MLDITGITAFNDNYIWAIHHKSSAGLTLVDPGEAEPCLAFLKKSQLSLQNILITHWHNDHTGAIVKLKSHYPEALVIGPKHAKIPADLQVSDKQNIELNTHRFDIIHTPGHTLEHLVYYSAELAALFSGDTLFAGGCGRLFEGDATMMLSSLNKLSALPPNTKIYCAHEYTLNNLRFALMLEPDNTFLKERFEQCTTLRNQCLPTVPSTLNDELQSNPFLRIHHASIRQKLEQRAQKTLSDNEAFAVLREWKNQF